MKPFLFLIPLMLIIPIFLKVTGVFVSVPLSDFFTAMISLIFIYREMKKMSELNVIQGKIKMHVFRRILKLII